LYNNNNNYIIIGYYIKRNLEKELEKGIGKRNWEKEFRKGI
jgi:hypothetical protein